MDISSQAIRVRNSHPTAVPLLLAFTLPRSASYIDLLTGIDESAMNLHRRNRPQGLFTEVPTGSLLIQEKAANRTSGEPNLWSSSSLFMGIAQTYHEQF